MVEAGTEPVIDLREGADADPRDDVDTRTVLCRRCGHHFTRHYLRPHPEGGALCKDWFECEVRRETLPHIIPKRFGP